MAAITSPGHSWANLAERVIGLFNFDYQNVVLYPEEMNSSLEQIIKFKVQTPCQIFGKKAASADNLQVERMMPYTCKAWSHC